MKISSVELKQMGNKHPDQNHLHTVFHALADLTEQHQETSDTLTTLIESTGKRLDDLTNELAALRAEVDEKLTFLAGCGDDLKARVERLEKQGPQTGLWEERQEWRHRDD